MHFRPACLLAVTALLLAPPTVAVSDLVTLPYARYMGVALGNGVTQWLGMRYAAPPTGSRRFRPPEEPHEVQGIRAAAAHGNLCLVTGQPPDVPGHGEDCLFVNVQAPTDATIKSRLPVLMWLRGDGYGDAQSYTNINASSLIEGNGRDMIVVTFNSRLGPYGFLGRVDGIATNIGLRDQIKAMQWVARFIRYFGGDPKHIVLGGSGIGAQNVLVHLTMFKDVNPNFKAIIAESPSFAPMLDLVEAEEQYHKFAEQMGCSSRGKSKSTRRSTDESTYGSYGSQGNSSLSSADLPPYADNTSQRNASDVPSYGGYSPSRYSSCPSGGNIGCENDNSGQNAPEQDSSGQNPSTQNTSEQTPPQQNPEQTPEQSWSEKSTSVDNTPECLRALSSDEIQKVNHKAVMSTDRAPPWDQWLPVIDYELIVNTTSDSFRAHHFALVPYLMGNLVDAGTAFLHRNASSTDDIAAYMKDLYPHLMPQDLEEIFKAYPNENSACLDPRGCSQGSIRKVFQDSRYICPVLAAAESFKRAGVASSFMYLWEAGDEGDDYEELGARQNLEAALLWGTEHGRLPVSFQPDGVNHPVSFVKQRYWANFVRSLNPNRRAKYRDFDASMEADEKTIKLRVWRNWFIRVRRRLVFLNGGKTQEKTTKSLRKICTFWHRKADRMRI